MYRKDMDVFEVETNAYIQVLYSRYGKLFWPMMATTGVILFLRAIKFIPEAIKPQYPMLIYLALGVLKYVYILAVITKMKIYKRVRYITRNDYILQIDGTFGTRYMDRQPCNLIEAKKYIREAKKKGSSAEYKIETERPFMHKS